MRKAIWIPALVIYLLFNLLYSGCASTDRTVATPLTGGTSKVAGVAFLRTEDGQRLQDFRDQEAELIELWWDRGGNVGGKLTADEQERFLKLGEQIVESE